MTQLSQQTHPPDALDRALSAFFKAQMRDPWPAAPGLTAEPSLAAAAHAPTAPARRPPVADPGRRARATLAASVALLVGTCWYFSPDLRPAARGHASPPASGGPNVLGGATAKTPDVFDQGKKEKAKESRDPMSGFRPGPIVLP